MWSRWKGRSGRGGEKILMKTMKNVVLLAVAVAAGVLMSSCCAKQQAQVPPPEHVDFGK